MLLKRPTASNSIALCGARAGKIISVGEDKSGKILSMAYWNSMISTVKEYDKILTARNLGAMLSAGLSLARALTILERRDEKSKTCERSLASR